MYLVQLQEDGRLLDKYMKKGSHHSKTANEKNKLAHLGKIPSEATKKKIRQAGLGRKPTKATLKKLHECKLGNNYRLGYKCSDATRIKMADVRRGVKSHLWKGGIYAENKRARRNIEIRLWREAVFARDNWTCQKCKKRGGILNAHHIQSFAEYPELRTSIGNGITFCEKCHKKFHKKYNKKNDIQ